MRNASGEKVHDPLATPTGAARVSKRSDRPPPFDADPFPPFPKCKCKAELGIIYRPDGSAWTCDACGWKGKLWPYDDGPVNNPK